MNMKIAIGADHGGVELKSEIIEYFKEKGYTYTDYGTYSAASVDYPDIGLKVAEAIKNKEADRGIVICGTGIGIGISANKVPGIRCAVCSDTYSAKYTRLHNDANMLAMGERVVGPGLAMEIVDVFLSTPFEGGRHAARVDMISEIEKKYNK